MAEEQDGPDSFVLLERWRSGDQAAAAELFQRYAQRLIGLAQRRLSEKMAARVDPADVIQSVYGSFFAGARNGRFVLQRSGDLWRLLVAITLHKVRRQIEYHTAEKRSINREESLDNEEGERALDVQMLGQEPSPAEAAALTDTLETILGGLKPFERRTLELRLQGYTLPEIAVDTGRSLASVERSLDRVKEQLRSTLAGANG
jgi:RNA polymerase sigma factor (sigma-70 family)